MLQISSFERLVHKGSRSCLEGLLIVHIHYGRGRECCMFPNRGQRLDLQALDSVEVGKNYVTHRTSGIVCISMVFSCIYS